MVRPTDPHRAPSRGRPRRPALGRARAWAAPLCAALVTTFGWFNPGAGQDPPDRGLYFPVGISVSNSGKTLFVVNSNFDLRFNAGTLQALDIGEIWARAQLCMPKIANARIDASTGKTIPKDPDRICALGTDPSQADVTDLIKTSVRIGAFGADVVTTPRFAADGTPDPAGAPRGRLMIPVRGDATLTLVDYEETPDASGNIVARKLICSRNAVPNSFGSACAAEWRVGGDATQNSRQIALEGEPFAVAVPGYWPTTPLVPDPDPTKPNSFESPRSVNGVAAIVHQQTGDVSVFVGTAGLDNQTIPQAKLAFTINGIPPGGTFITPLDLVDEHPFTPRFLVTTRSQADVYVLSFFADKGSPDRSGLAIYDTVLIPTQSTGFDSRGIVVDPPEDGEVRPIRVFLTSRTPASLVVGEINPVDHRLRFFDNQQLPIGPSRVVRARLDVELPDGTFVKRTRLLATSFDGRFVTSYDPDLRTNTDVVRTGKGPYTIVVSPSSGTRTPSDDADPAKRFRPQLGFVTNFTDSTIQVIDLDPRAGLFDDELEAAGHPEKKAPPGTLGPLFGQVIYTVGSVQQPGT